MSTCRQQPIALGLSVLAVFLGGCGTVHQSSTIRPAIYPTLEVGLESATKTAVDLVRSGMRRGFVSGCYTYVNSLPATMDEPAEPAPTIIPTRDGLVIRTNGRIDENRCRTAVNSIVKENKSKFRRDPANQGKRWTKSDTRRAKSEALRNTAKLGRGVIPWGHVDRAYLVESGGDLIEGDQWSVRIGRRDEATTSNLDGTAENEACLVFAAKLFNDGENSARRFLSELKYLARHHSNLPPFSPDMLRDPEARKEDGSGAEPLEQATVSSAAKTVVASDGQNLPRVAVMQIAPKAGVSAELADPLADLVANAIGSLGRFEVIGKSDITAMIGFERVKDRIGCDDASCLAEIGGALGVHYIVSGNIARLGRTFLVNIRAIDPTSAKVVGGTSLKVTGGEDKLIDAVGQAAKQVLPE